LAADITPAQRSSIEDSGNKFFHAVVDGNSKGVMAYTTPSFTLTTLEGQTLSASDLASKWQVMMIEYGGVHGDAKLNSASTDGSTITTLFTIVAYADTNSPGRNAQSASMLNAIHKIVWVPSGDTYKAASDTVLRQSSDFRAAPSF
jgi:hypothetical protein